MDRQSMTDLSHKFTVVANWKMNKTIVESLSYVNAFVGLVKKPQIPVWIAVPFTAIKTIHDALASSSIVVGAQNMNDATSGAFTGEVAGLMIKDAGGEFVILGHSERRTIFHETDECINKKVLRALECSLLPLVCIGEGFDDRETGQTEAVLRKQLVGSLQGVQPSSCVIAYEPIWAIGTGKTATPELVAETHQCIRNILAESFGENQASTSLLYGGSVSPTTAEALAATNGVDGFLVGTASLQPESFAKIVHVGENVKK
jgi:triosephosphate isomerase